MTGDGDDLGKVKLGYFSFTEITDPAEHRLYNEWHQLDHMPEQFPLEGMAHGQRWVHSPRCRDARMHVDPELDATHYMTLYLMGEPLEQTLRDFIDLGAKLSALGRFHRKRRGLMSGPFLLLKKYVSPRLSVSADCLPHRPCRGILVVMHDVAAGARADAFATWLDRVHYPDMLGIDGIAGVWTFFSRGEFSEAFVRNNPPGRRIAVYYLDGDPIDVVAEMNARSPAWQREGRLPDFSDAATLRFAAPLETITPWQWDWFDKDA